MYLWANYISYNMSLDYKLYAELSQPTTLSAAPVLLLWEWEWDWEWEWEREWEWEWDTRSGSGSGSGSGIVCRTDPDLEATLIPITI
jgi:hypothetical protein